MAARMVRVAGVVMMAIAMPLAGCSSGDGVGSEEPRAAAVEAARSFQQAVLDREWKAACEARTELLRGGTVAECVEETTTPRLHDYPGARVSTGEPFDVDADGLHPAGVGLRLSVETSPGAAGPRWHTAMRLVPGDSGEWFVDQLVNLDDETMDTDTDAVRAALRRK